MIAPQDTKEAEDEVLATRCIECGAIAETFTPTGHPACRQCVSGGPLFADVLDDVAAFISRFVVFSSDHQLVAVTLWVAHTYLVDRLRTTPYLHISSPEPESGKSRLLDVLELLVHNPWITITPSPAVLYRKIDKESENGGLTLLLDEVDPIFKRGSDDSAEALRAVLNAGYQKGRTVARCVPPKQHIEEYDVFGAKALAGLGPVPDTIASRSIRIAMKRRKQSEPIEPLFPDELTDEVKDLVARLAYVRDVDLSGLRRIRRDLLSLGLGDRAADGWSSLVAIAEEAGGVWPGKATKAAEALSRKQTYESDHLGLRVLADSRMVLKGWPHDHVFSSDLRDGLIGLEDAPWEDHFGKPISQRKIATLLADYEVRSATRRIGDETRKGYSIIDFEDAWQRYLPPESVTNVTSQSVEGETPSSHRSQTGVVTDPESPVSPVADWGVTDVTDQMRLTGAKPDAIAMGEATAYLLFAFPDSEEGGCVVCDKPSDPCTCDLNTDVKSDGKLRSCTHKGQLLLHRRYPMHVDCAPLGWEPDLTPVDVTDEVETERDHQPMRRVDP